MNEREALILQQRQAKKQAAELRAASLGVSTMVGKLNGKVLFLEGRVTTLEAQIAKLLRKVGLKDG